MHKKTIKYRKKINKIDNKILDLLSRRFFYVSKISNIKKNNDTYIYDENRENIQNFNLIKKGSYYENIYKIIKEESRKLQIDYKIALIGNNLSHSLSPLIHHLISQYLNIPYSFQLIEDDDINSTKIIELLKKGYYKAFFITMPYKKTFIRLCDFLTKDAYETKVINLIYTDGMNIIGTNTDLLGFIYSFKKYDFKKHVPYILGNGATSSTFNVGLLKLGYKCPIKVTNNINDKDQISYDMLNLLNPKLVLNATPVGLSQDDPLLLPLDKLNQVEFFYDCLYNKNKTNHILKSIDGKNGLDMLIMQAIYGIKQIYSIDVNENDLFNYVKERVLYEN